MAAVPASPFTGSADPVTFTGEDAARFLGELPAALRASELKRLRAAVAAGSAALASKSANSFFD